MIHRSKYAEKLLLRNRAQKVVRHALTNEKGDLVGPHYGLEFRMNHETGEQESIRVKPVFPNEIRATPFSFEIA